MARFRGVVRSWLAGALLLIAALPALAADQAGTVTFAGIAVPGATVIAVQGDRRVTTITDEAGAFAFTGLADGPMTIAVEMTGFAPARVEVGAPLAAAPISVALALRSFEEVAASGQTLRANAVEASSPPLTTTAETAAASAQATSTPMGSDVGSDLASAAADGFLVNGSVNNGASSPFAQAAAFGNNRNLRRSLYNGMFGAVIGNSAWDSRPFAFAGTPGTKPSYDDLQILGTFGGPIPTRGPLNMRPNLFTGYQRSIEHAASAQSGIVPTARERAGDFSQSHSPSGAPLVLRDPTTDQPFPGLVIPADRISPSAASLLGLYPFPNLSGNGRFNYQAPVLTRTEREALQTRVTQNLNTRNQLLASVQYQRTRTDATSLFGFTSASSASTLDAGGTWTRRVSPFFTSRLRYQFSRTGADVVPHFAGQRNVLADAGISGTDRVPLNWGPPSLTFASGLLGLADVQYLDQAATSHGAQAEALLFRGRHNMTLGSGYRRIALNADGQQNGRGAFGFTGAATGSDLADFLLGLPQTAALAVGNQDKALRANAVEAFISDDWRLSPGLTLNLGLRWDYESPFTERLGRLSNLDLSDSFSAAGLVTPSAPAGPVTGRRFPAGLLQRDLSGLQPRLGLAWRPVAGSSLVLRAGYGIYRNLSTYQPIALLMAQQPPFSNALSLEATPTSPLTLSDGLLFTATSPSTFAVDPNFRVGSAHNWQITAQRDLPASLTMSASYLGTRGTRLMQEFLPNTVPAGSVSACASCPVGFIYLTSNGSSSRHAGQIQVRRRLRDGLQASGQYTYSVASDNAGAFTGAALSGAVVAQDWRDLEAEWGPSSFNQRHLFTADVQYTTGVGVRGGGLLSGARGALVKGWTVTSQLSAGSGFPLTSVYLGVLPGTGLSGSLRASRSGPQLAPPPGYYLHPDAYRVPTAGSWGDAGRNSVMGPRQFALSAGVARSFPWGDRVTLDWRIDATNVLNVVTYAAVNTVVGSPQFGLPTRANPMRKIQTSIRFRF